MLTIYFRAQRVCLGVINSLSSLGRDVGPIPPLFYALGTCLMLLLHGLVAKQVSLILLLSKPIWLWFYLTCFTLCIKQAHIVSEFSHLFWVIISLNVVSQNPKQFLSIYNSLMGFLLIILSSYSIHVSVAGHILISKCGGSYWGLPVGNIELLIFVPVLKSLFTFSTSQSLLRSEEVIMEKHSQI